jgi:hypothetical protein
MKMWLLLLMIIVFPCQSAMDITRELVAPEHAVPGQPMTVSVTFWTDSWFNPPPVWPEFSIEGGMLLNTPLPDQLLTRQKNGISWSGVRLERQVVAWDQGTLHLPAVDITVNSSGQAPVTVHLPAQTVAVAWPPNTQQPDRFISARELEMNQQITSYHAGKDHILRAGDTVDRIVTLTGKDIIPVQIPQILYAIPGDGSQRLAPVNDYIKSARGDIEKGIRQERIRYFLARSGTLVIPPVQLRWWDTEHQKWQQATLEGKTLKILEPVAAGSEKILQARTANNAGLLSVVFLLTMSLLFCIIWLIRKPLTRGLLWLIIRWHKFWSPVHLPYPGNKD